MKKLLILSCLTLTIFACEKLDESTVQAKLKSNLNYQYDVSIPYIQLADNSPDHNRVSNAGAALGRVLFYDERLSVNNNTACASCHKQELAFADGLQLSPGFDNELTNRNSMSLVNLATMDKLFWDGRTPNLEQLATEPISHPVEMGFEKIHILPKKLALSNYYPELFRKAYGTDEITTDRIANALAQFLRSMTTFSAPVDNTNIPNGSWSTNVPNFTEAEKAGLLLFRNSRCDFCHNGANFGGSQFFNIGLDLNYTDPGIGTIGSNLEGFFKVPSLRNVELTAPYMHDGRFATLSDVIDHYSTSIAPHSNLSPILTNASWNNPNDNSPVRFHFNEGQKQNLIAFLKTLTDRNFIKDERFSDPFIRN